MAFRSNLLLLKYQSEIVEQDLTKQSFGRVTVLNWIAMYWTFTGSKNEDMWIVVEAETRGWVAMGFTNSDMDLEGSEVVKGYILKSDESPALDKVEIGSYRLGKEGWADLIDNSKKNPIYNTSLCQTSDGRTIMKFRRKTVAGKHPIEAWVGSYAYMVSAVGEMDKSPTVIEHAEFSVSPWQSKIGPEEPEGWSFRWVFTYVLLYFHIITWLLH